MLFVMQIVQVALQLGEAPLVFASFFNHIVYHGPQRNNLLYLIQLLKLNIEP